jgi:hypothetical protein
MFDRFEKEKIENRAWRAGYYFGAATTTGLFMLAGYMCGRGWLWIFH